MNSYSLWLNYNNLDYGDSTPRNIDVCDEYLCGVGKAWPKFGWDGPLDNKPWFWEKFLYVSDISHDVSFDTHKTYEIIL